MAMSPREGDEVAVGGQDDELSRQRRKRAARLAEESPSRFDDSRVRAVLADVLAAIEQRGGDFDVERYLVDHRHDQETVQRVLAQLGLSEVRHPSGWPPASRGRW
jgi:hypothetical protein